MAFSRRPTATLAVLVLSSAGLAAAPESAASAAAPPGVLFSYTGAPQTYTVPANVTALQVEACGAAGADLASIVNAEGGHGAQVASVVSVVPGEQLAVLVGGTGEPFVSGGFNGGGSWGGGGATDLRQHGTGLANRIVVAGGGGSAGATTLDVTYGFAGGDGGLIGSAAADSYGYAGGFGGSQTAGGAGGAPVGLPFPGFPPELPGSPGRLGFGGDGHASAGNQGAGGGGGLYGGGGGGGGGLPGIAVWTGAGGGGSSLADSVVDGACQDHGWLRITETEPRPTVTPGVATIVEGDAGSAKVSVPVTLSAPAAGPVSVQWTTVGPAGVSGIATTDVDFEGASGTVQFAPGQTSATIGVNVLGDVTDEPPLTTGEWGLIVLTGASPNVQFGTGFFSHVSIFVIVDDDPTPTVRPGAAEVIEGNTGSVFVDVPVTLSNPSAQSITTTWHTVAPGPSPGLAASGIDFVAKRGAVTFAPGQTSATITIEVLGDTTPELPLVNGEWGLIVLDTVSPTGRFGTTSYFDRLGVFVIIDDDVPA